MMYGLRLALLFGAALPAIAAGPLDEILGRMDTSARQFQAFTAKVKWVDFTSVLSESTEHMGTVRTHKTKAGTFGILEFGEPDPSIKRFGGRTFETYYPKGNTVEIIDVGKRAGAVEQFLLLGFAVPASEIRKNYDVKLGGPETLGSVKTTRIELYPKSSEIKNLIAKIELWIPDGQSNPIQEKVTKPSKDYSLIVYSDMKLNPSLPNSDFELKLPPNVKKIYPQK